MYKYLNVTVTLLTHPNLIMSFVISILIKKSNSCFLCRALCQKINKK